MIMSPGSMAVLTWRRRQHRTAGFRRPRQQVTGRPGYGSVCELATMPGVAAPGMLPSKAALQGAAMQIERSATSISWIPSDSIPGLLKVPFREGVMHYDPPPPLAITHLAGMRRRGEFRFANVLRTWIDVEDGKIRDLRALTRARVAETAPGVFTAEQLSELAQGHHREDSAAGR
jgi:hypothetical protein